MSSSWGHGRVGGSRLPSLPIEGLPGSAQQVVQVDRDTVLVCFDRECPGVRASDRGGGVVRDANWVTSPEGSHPIPAHQPYPCAGCVRIVNLLGEPTATLAPVLTFDFPIETVGE